LIRGAALALGLCAAAAAQAQEVDCAAPVTQQDSNFCADRAWKLADEDLNLAYGMARSLMQQTDAALPQADRGAEVALRDAQRAWITFRDAACRAEGYVFFGGSIRPLVVSNCLERMTRARTEDLRALAEPH
jgi:uncharacterized protein YecT (DUF1311 family)